MNHGGDQHQLRVLAVTNLWPESGSFRGIFVREQVEMLRRRGLHVDVEVVAQGRGRLDYVLARRRVRARVDSGRYDLLHVHYGLTTLATRSIKGLPCVLSLYGSDINVAWQRRITKSGWGNASVRIYMSRATADAAREPAGVVIPNGVDFDLFAPIESAAARAALGINGEERVVLFGGHPENAVKGYDVFTDVMAALRGRGIAVRELILAETGQARSAVPMKFAAADVLLFTSRKGFESSPTVVKEATAMGLPVVSVAVGDVAEVLSGVTPSAVVNFPEPWGSASARTDLVRDLADRTAEVLLGGVRSDGRERNIRLDLGRATDRLVEVYYEVMASTGAGWKAGHRW